MVFALAAGPLTNLLLVMIGFMLLKVEDLLLNRIGLFLIVSNSLMDIGSALTSVRYAILHLDLYTSEPAWKLLLLPFFTIALYLGFKTYHERITLRGLALMTVVTVCLGFTAIPLDKLLWTCIRQGVSYCGTIAGISIPVIITNTTVAIITVTYVARFGSKLRS